MNARLSRRSRLIPHRQRIKYKVLRILHRSIVARRIHGHRRHLRITILVLRIRIGAIVYSLKAREISVVQHFVHDEADLVIRARPVSGNSGVGDTGGVADGRRPGGGGVIGA